jgi:hypothetical protein
MFIVAASVARTHIRIRMLGEVTSIAVLGQPHRSAADSADAFAETMLLAMASLPVTSRRRVAAHTLSSSTAGRRLAALPRHHHVNLAAAALRTDQPLAPIRQCHLGAVALSLFGGIGFNLVTAIAAPHDRANAGRRRTS